MKWVHMKNNVEYDDNELLSLLAEDEENIKNLIYDKYKYIIDILIHKYQNTIKTLQIDEQEVKCEALYGFSDGINSFRENKNATLKTFLSLCIERRIIKYITKFTTNKAKIIKEALSLDCATNDNNLPLIDMITDVKVTDPLNNLTSVETISEIINIAKDNLSEFEYTVFNYMVNEVPYQEVAQILGKTPKQIDNTIQRVKQKLRKVLNANK